VAALETDDMVDQGFAYYALLAKLPTLLEKTTGSVFPNLSRDDIGFLSVPWPDRTARQAVVGLLGALDDKIDSNDQVRHTSLKLIKAFFEHIERPLSAPIVLGAPPPHGWLVTVLEEWLETLETGSRPRGGVSHYTSGVPSIGAESIVELAAFDYSKTKFVPRDYYLSMKRGIACDRDVLLYKDGGRPGEFEPHVSLFGDDFPFPEFCINEHVYRLRTREPLSQEYLYCWLSSDPLLEQMRRRGTGVAIPGLNSAAVKSLPIAVPPQEELREFAFVAKPLVRQGLAAAKERQILANLRDVLLPPLLSGDLAVRGADSLVGDSA
jgi:type I restriction enzyme S subunit